MTKPTVAHLTTAHPANDVRIFERECRSLASSGLYTVCLAASGQIPPDSGVSFIPLTAIPTSRIRRFASGPRKAHAIISALKVDLWHIHDPELLPTALEAIARGIPVIWDAHEDYLSQFTADDDKKWIPGPLRGLAREGTHRLLRAIDKRAAGVIAATPAIAARYSNHRTVVVGNEARIEDFADCTPDFDSRTVLFTGNVGPRHLFDDVVAAIDSIPATRMSVAGRQPDAETWKRAKARLGGRLDYVGWLDRSALARAIDHVALGMCTYADLPTNYANSPNKIFEFGAASLPVVATPNPSNLQFLAESGAGFVAQGYSAAAIAQAISSALSDRQVWTRASLAGRQWAQRVGSWKQSEERLLNLYAEILGGSERT